MTKNPRASVFYQQYCKHRGLWLVHTWLTVCYWLVMYALYARLLIFFNYWTFLPGQLHFKDSNNCNVEVGWNVERGLFWMNDQISFMRKPLLKWEKNICIKPDYILQSGIIKTAIYKMKNHLTWIHFEKCHNKGSFYENERT